MLHNSYDSSNSKTLNVVAGAGVLASFGISRLVNVRRVFRKVLDRFWFTAETTANCGAGGIARKAT